MSKPIWNEFVSYGDGFMTQNIHNWSFHDMILNKPSVSRRLDLRNYRSSLGAVVQATVTQRDEVRSDCF
jgi:hypothetical protein